MNRKIDVTWNLSLFKTESQVLFHVFSGLPLRPSDTGSNYGHIIHYHRSKHSRSAQRHIHYQTPPPTNSKEASIESVQSSSEGVGNKVGAIYEVPSNRRFGDTHYTGDNDIDVNVKQLQHVIRKDGMATVSLMAKPFAARESTLSEVTFQPIVTTEAFSPIRVMQTQGTTGSSFGMGNVQFLSNSRRKRRRNDFVPNSKAVNSDYLRNELVGETRTVRSSDNVKSRKSKSNRDKFFMGMFQPYQSQNKETGAQNETANDVIVNTEKPILSEFYHKSTVHSRQITKRQVIGDVHRTHQTLIDNVLNVNVGSTPPLPRSDSTTDAVSRYLKSIMSSEYSPTHIEPGVGTTQSMGKDVSTNDFIHLKGIHIAFSNGNFSMSNTIPTIHLTAALAPPKGVSIQTQGEQTNTTNKIVGTAMIKDGHLYLVVYPIGENKSLDIMMDNKTSKVTLPHNKPVSYTHMATTRQGKRLRTPSTTAAIETTSSPPPPTTTTTTTTTTNMSPSSSASEYSTPRQTTTTTTAAPATTTTVDPLELFVSDFLNDLKHMDHDMHLHKPKQRNGTMEIKDVPRFLSPWRKLNLTSILPLQNKNDSTNPTDNSDTEIKIYKFVAQATDPFEEIKAVIKNLTNNNLGDQSSNNSSSVEATFNFELKVQSSIVENTIDTKHKTTTPVIENSEEQTETTTKPLTTFETTSKPTVFSETTIQPVKENKEIVTESTVMHETVSPSIFWSETFTSKPSTRLHATTKTMYPTQISRHVFPTTEIFNRLVTQPSLTALLNRFSSNVANSYFEATQLTTPTTTTSRPPQTLPSFSMVSGMGSGPQKGRHTLDRGQTEQVMSLSDILNDIRRIQLHNMARFNIQNNNFDTMLVSESARQATQRRANQRARQRPSVVVDGPVYTDNVQSQFSPQTRHHTGHNANQNTISEQMAINNALDAMLVLSVDEFLADHTNLHGAIVMASKSSSNNKQE